MDSVHDTPKGWVAPFGHPRIKACSRLPMAFRSVPRPSSPPGAKASTECPSLAREHSSPDHVRGFHHARKPSTENPIPPAQTRSVHHPSDQHPRHPASRRFRLTADLSLSTYPTHRPHPHPKPSPRPTGQSPMEDKARPRRQHTRQIGPTPLNTRRIDAGAALCITHRTNPVRHAPTQRGKPTPDTATSRSRSPA